MKFETTIRVRESEIDGQQVVHNSRYLEYAQAIAEDYWAWTGIVDACKADWRHVRVHIRRAEIDFILPFLRGDTIRAHASIERIGRSSLTNRFELTDSTTGQLKAVIIITSVNVDASSGRPSPIAPSLRDFLEGVLARQTGQDCVYAQSSSDR